MQTLNHFIVSATVEDDDTVTVTSTSGNVTRKIRIDKSLGAGQIFVPTGFNDNEAMCLFSLSDMTTPGSPGWKTCRVQVEKARSEDEEEINPDDIPF